MYNDIPKEFQEDRALANIFTKRGKDLYKIIISYEKYKNSYLKHSYQEFKSKKNTVAYVIFNGKPMIIKRFVPGSKNNMENEYSILKKAHDLHVPSVFEKDEHNNILIMSYINGENLCEIINSETLEFEEKRRILILLSQWFSDFHEKFKNYEKKLIHGDSALRNFIFSKKIYGLDFEESRQGKNIEDIAELCASILSTNPMFEIEKFELCKIFIKSYTEKIQSELKGINNAIVYSLLKKIQWRPDQENILRNYGNIIKKRNIFQFI